MKTNKLIIYFILVATLFPPSCKPDKKMLVETGEASNIHGYIHGRGSTDYYYTGGIEEDLYEQILFFIFNVILFQHTD
ncbi:MAG: hypothetical protein A2V64_13510 [Bacteroidetes bacterium RBG_13_43_22]|nr:MAG: hypothetical protein A2V64_13510 [Bacteroidetes bacterium RBG_13_43_22]OFY82468.1 MAG: hypothetical protein A2V46_08600 [Bacteroidetes bacterium RBG_19FT_COMBO_42_7]